MKKKIIIAIAAILVFLSVFLLLGPLLTPKYTDNREGALTGEYYTHEGGHDVLFVGDCEVYESFVPTVLWDKYGITSYVRGGPQQLAWHSYYLLEEALKYNKPKAVVYNVYALKHGTPQNEARNRMTFDTMKWSLTKIKAINASMLKSESFIDYIFPTLRYHSRVTELGKDDFKYWFADTPNAADCGYLMQTDIDPMPAQEDPQEPESYILPSSSMKYLDKMRELCEENSIALILVKAPTNSSTYYWFDDWEEQIREYADEYSLEYYNFIPKCEEIGIDWNVDTYDKGLHLNVYGAEKLTEYFGKILQDEHGIKNQKDNAALSEVWEEYLHIYNERKEKMEEE